MSTVKTANDIQRQMRQVRRDLDQEMGELVDNAKQITEQFTDWRAYVKSNPWLYLGLAAGLGYVIVPTRVTVERPVADTLADLAKSGTIKVTKAQPEKSLVDQAIDMGISIASSAALQYGMNLLNRGLREYLTPGADSGPPDLKSTGSSLKV
jgi:hypothetical protein